MREAKYSVACTCYFKYYLDLQIFLLHGIDTHTYTTCMYRIKNQPFLLTIWHGIWRTNSNVFSFLRGGVLLLRSWTQKGTFEAELLKPRTVQRDHFKFRMWSLLIHIYKTVSTGIGRRYNEMYNSDLSFI